MAPDVLADETRPPSVALLCRPRAPLPRMTLSEIVLMFWKAAVLVLVLMPQLKVESLAETAAVDSSSTPETTRVAPYRVIWNSPWPLLCYRQHFNPPGVNFSKYHIDVNGNENGSMSEYGGETIILYNEDLGLYPKLGKGGAFINGGVPQLAVKNLSAHLKQIEWQFEHGQIHGLFPPTPTDFAGLGVIDWEAFVFSWQRWAMAGDNTAAMKLSVELVRQEHPSWNDSQLSVEAARQYDAAVQQFIEATLTKLKQLRPKARFGFFTEMCPAWGLIAHSGNGPLTKIGCRSDFEEMHNNEAWLWNASDAIFAQIYMVRPPGTYANPPHGSVNITAASNRLYVDGQMAEAMRLAQMGRNTDTEVFAYARAMYSVRADKDSTHGVYNSSAFIDRVADLDDEIARPGLHGAAGSIIWGSSDDCLSKNLCDGTASYVQKKLGPLAAAAVQSNKACVQMHCGGVGRCRQLDDFGNTLATPTCIKTDDDSTRPVLLSSDTRARQAIVQLGPVTVVGNGSDTTSEFWWNGTHAVHSPATRYKHLWFCAGYMVPLGPRDSPPRALLLHADTALDQPWQPVVNGDAFLSQDGGASWQRLASVQNVMNTAVLAADGSALGIPMHIQPLGYEASASSTWNPPCEPESSAASSGCRVWSNVGRRYRLTSWGSVEHSPVTITFRFPQALSSAIMIGNVLALPDNRTLLTTLYGGFLSNPTDCQRCPKPDIIAMTSVDGGLHWDMASIIAHWSEPTPESLDPTAEGPTESTTTLMDDGSILAVFRIDAYFNYRFSVSEDSGLTWTTPRALLGPHAAGSDIDGFAGPHGVMPRITRLSNGVYCLTGGRAGLFLWTWTPPSPSANLAQLLMTAPHSVRWTEHNLAEHHNASLANSTRWHAKRELYFNSTFVSSPNVVSMNYDEESTSYTQVVEVERGRLLICYDKIGNNKFTRFYNPPPYSNMATVDYVFCVTANIQTPHRYHV